MNSPRTHGVDALPAWAPPDGRDVHRLAAPRSKDDLWIPTDHLGRVDHPLGGRRLVSELGKDVATARELDDLGDPTNPRDERIVPLLEVHPGPIRPYAGELTYLLDLVSHVLDEISRLAIETEEAAHHDDDGEHIIERARIGAEDREAGSDQLGADLGLEIREGENEVGLQLPNLVHAKAGERAHLRLLARFRRAMRGPRHPDHALSCPQCVADLHVL